MFARINLARTLAALTLCAASAAPLAATRSDTDYTDSVGAAWVRAVKAGDLEGVMKLYANDAVAWFPDETEHRGTAAIRESYKVLFDTFIVEDAALTQSHHVGDAKHRTNWGTFLLKLKQKSDGKSMPMSGRYTDLQERRDGRWLYIVDHASADPPPKPATK